MVVKSLKKTVLLKRKIDCSTALTKGGGKSTVNISEDLSPTLTTTHDGAPVVAYGCDMGTTRDVGKMFLREISKTLTNGTCPGHHNHICLVSGVDPYNGAMTGDVEPTLGINCGISTGRNGVYECETDSDE